MKEWLDNNNFLIHSTYNDGKSAIAKRFIKTLKAKIYTKTRRLVIENLILVI